MTQVFEKHQVVMLPTNEKADLRIGKTHGVLHYKNNIFDESLGVYQHLYFLSDEEIKKGDWSNPGWYIDFRVSDTPVISNTPIHKDKAFACKKIIATTDKSLGADYNGAFGGLGKLPQPSQLFVEKYVEEYNKGNVITEVMIEFEVFDNQCDTVSCAICNCSTDTEELEYKLKTNPGGTINIKPAKDSWNREEITPLIDFLKEIAKDNLDRVSPGIKMRAMTYLAAFEKNL